MNGAVIGDTTERDTMVEGSTEKSTVNAWQMEKRGTCGDAGRPREAERSLEPTSSNEIGPATLSGPSMRGITAA